MSIRLEDIVFRIAIALAVMFGSAGTSLGANQSPLQRTGYRQQIAQLESKPPTPPPGWEVKKFRSTEAKAEVKNVRLLAAHVRDSKHRLVNLIGVRVINPPRNPEYGKIRFKIYSLSGRLIGSRQIFGVRFGFMRLERSSWEDVVPHGFTRTLKLVLHDHGEKGFCVRGGFVPRQCTS